MVFRFSQLYRFRYSVNILRCCSVDKFRSGFIPRFIGVFLDRCKNRGINPLLQLGKERFMNRFGILNHLILSISICLLALTGCGKLEKHSIDVPEGYASQTLKEFAKQAGIEIVFNAPSVANVKTNAVSGRMTPLVALDLILSGTNLVFERDQETGAYAVTVIDESETVASVKQYDLNNQLIEK